MPRRREVLIHAALLLALSSIIQGALYVVLPTVEALPPSKIDYVLNYFEYRRSTSGITGCYQRQVPEYNPWYEPLVVHTYHAFQRGLPPRPEEIIAYLDGRQQPTGFWSTRKYPLNENEPGAPAGGSYAGDVAWVLRGYRYLGVRPRYDMDATWFPTIDTWSEVLADAASTYNGVTPMKLLEYIMAWLEYHPHQPPPWMNDYWAWIETSKSVWITDYLQASVTGVVYTFFRDFRTNPYLDEMVSSVISQQNADGSWRAGTMYTLPAAWFLAVVNKLTPRTDAATSLQRAGEFVESCYVESGTFGAFTWFLGGTHFDVETTALGSQLSVLTGRLPGDMDPTGEETRPPAVRTHTLTIQSSPIASVQFNLNGSLTTTPYSAPKPEGICIIAMPSSVTFEGKDYTFSNWEDGSTNASKTVNLLRNTTITAYYEQAPPPPPPSPPATFFLILVLTLFLVCLSLLMGRRRLRRIQRKSLRVSMLLLCLLLSCRAVQITHFQTGKTVVTQILLEL